MNRSRALTHGLGEAGGWVLVAIVLAPVLALLAMSFDGLLGGHLGPRAFRLTATTLALGLGTSVLAILWGVSCAWLVEMCVFPGRKALGFLLFLPFAIPAYLQAYVWADLVDDGGWLPVGLGVRNLPGACIVMSLVLYPYVYMFARGAFAQRSCGLSVAARVLGCTAWGSFFRVSLPVARPAIAVGALLVFMEVANDIAIAEDYGLSTLGYHIYDVWLNRDDRQSAAAMAFILMIMAVVLVATELFSRRRQKQYEVVSHCSCSYAEHRLHGFKAVLAMSWGMLVFSLGFAMPVIVLVYRMAKGATVDMDRVLEAFFDTAGLVVAVAAACFAVGGAVSLLAKSKASVALRALCKLTMVGYAFPGLVYGLGAIAIATGMASVLFDLTGMSMHWMWTTTAGLLVVALAFRFLVISSGSIESAMNAIPPGFGTACKMAGKSKVKSLLQVHLPLMRPVLTVGLLLLAVDVIKELPLTLILRPFDMQTLSVHIYQYAADEDLAGAAPAALAMVLSSVAMLALVYRWIVPAWQERKD